VRATTLVKGQKPMNTERRSAPRESLNSLVYLDIQPNNGGILLNLNTNGMRVSVAHPLTPGKAVCFSFSLDSPGRIEGTGRIVWVAESAKSAGIGFVNLSNNSITEISKWLKSASSNSIDEPDEHGNASWLSESPIAIEEAKNNDSRNFRLTSPPLSPFETASPLLVDRTHVGRSYDRPKLPNAADTAAPGARVTTSREVGALPELERMRNPTTHPQVCRASKESEEIGVASILAQEECARILPAVGEPKYISVSPAVRSGHADIGSNSDPPLIERAHTGPAAGLNDPLPVYELSGDPLLSPSSLLQSASGVIWEVILAVLRDIGWGLERDWHVSLGALLIVGGFAALAPRPPLLMLGLALWIDSALILTNRKQPPRDSKDPRWPMTRSKTDLGEAKGE
jgi:hypothetical protein